MRYQEFQEFQEHVSRVTHKSELKFISMVFTGPLQRFLSGRETQTSGIREFVVKFMLNLFHEKCEHL